MSKPTDPVRFDFIREFRVSLAWSELNKLWVAATQCGQSVMEKTPRKALDSLMKLTKKNPRSL